MARRQCHLLDLARIPRSDNVPPAVRIFFDLRDDCVNLIDAATVGGAPVRPLRAVNASQAAILVRPFVPDGHAVVVKVFDVRVAAQKPEQFINDGLGVDLLRGEQRKRFAQRTTDLRAEDGIRARAGAVGLEPAVFEDVPQQIEILNHRGKNLTTKSAKDTKRNLTKGKMTNENGFLPCWEFRR